MKKIIFLLLVALPFFTNAQLGIKYATFSGAFNGSNVVYDDKEEAGIQYATILSYATDSWRETKYNPDGSVAYQTVLGLQGYLKKVVVNGEDYVLGTVDPSTFKPTTGNAPASSGGIALIKINPNGGIDASTYIDAATVTDFQVVNNTVYLLGTTYDPDFPVVNGILSTNIGPGTFASACLIKLGADFSVNTSTCLTTLGLYNHNFNGSLKIDGSNLYILTNGGCDYFPVTDGTTGNMALIKLNADGTVAYSTRFSNGQTSATNSPDLDMQISNGQVYIVYDYAYVFNPTTNNNTPAEYYTVYSSVGKQIQLTPVSVSTYFVLKVENNIGYIIGSTANAGLPVTSVTGRAFAPGSPANSTDLYIQKINSTGITYASYIGGSGSEPFYIYYSRDAAFQVVNGTIYLFTGTTSSNYPVTDGSKKTYVGTSNVLTEIGANGNIVYSTYYTNEAPGAPLSVYVDNGIIYLASLAFDQSQPSTDGSSFTPGTSSSPYISALYACPTNYAQIKDTLSPSLQTVCKEGLANQINGKDVIIPGDSLPEIYLNGVEKEQNQINASYQWQIAASAAGPWSNISGAISKNYFPAVGGVTQYYRRLSEFSAACGSSVISTSDVDTVAVNTLTAPTVAAGGPFYTCPSSSLTIGGAPTATGGIAPYTYSWDNSAGTLANPVVAPSSNTLYTATVTDSKGCIQIGQALVNTYSANAGPDVSVCGTDSVIIGSPIIPGLTGITYSWSPTTGMSCSTCAQPKVKISGAPVTYTLTQTIAKSGGGTCSTSDAVIVTPVVAPNANFAGPDQTICLGGAVQLGTPAQPAYTYTWSPGTYLSTNAGSTTAYNPPSYIFPTSPNDPMTYYLTAVSGACSFYDTVVVATIESNAGINGCGPRAVGTPDLTPNINETYKWTKISGNGTITGATNTPTTTVSASTGVNSVYQLDVSYGGTTCSSQVVVTDACACNAQIFVNAAHNCPTTAFGQVILTAVPSWGAVTDWKYSWSPTAGLSSPTGNIDTLTDNVARTYTVTITNIYDPTIVCSQSIFVNGPGWAVPTLANRNSSVCSGTTADLGGPAIAHYGYAWTGYINNSSVYFTSTLSDPQTVITATSSVNLIEIDSTSGCTATGISTVTVNNPFVDAGPDYTICNNAIVTLGTPAIANQTYSWNPSTAPWQAGTSGTSAMPQVLLAGGATHTFILTATSTLSGCSANDTVNIFYNPSPQATASGDKIACSGGSVTIGSAPIPGATYSWTPTTGLSCTACAQPVATVTSNTTYIDIITFLGGCNATDKVNVTVDNPIFTLPDISFCPSQTLYLGANAPAGMNAYQWSPAGVVNNPNMENPYATPTPNTATTYTLTVTDANGCTGSNNETVIPTLIKPIAGSNGIMCSGTSQQIGDPSNLPTDSWSVQSAAGNYSLSCNTCAQPVFTPSAPGSYVLNVYRYTSDCSSSDQITITVDGLTLPTTNPITVCKGTCASIGVINQPGLTYSWSPSTGLSDPTVSMPTACVSANTNYVLTAVDDNGCAVTTSAYVAVNSVAAPSITIPGITICLTNQIPIAFNPTITGPAGALYTYSWSPSTGLSDPTILAPKVSTTSTIPTTYTLTVTNTSTGCQSSATGIASTSLCNTVNLSGTVFHDANGLTDNTVNGTGLGDPSGTYLYATLVNASGKVVATIKLSSTGTYSFSQVASGQYTIQISKNAGVVNSAVPTNALPTNWVYTGENIGTGAGSDGTPNGTISVTAASTDISNIDFGIEQPPVADPKCFNITDCLFTNNSIPNYVGIAMSSNSLTGYATGGALTGSDPEDCKNASSCNTDATFLIASISSNTLLYYTYTTSPVKVTAGTKISNFDPSKMTIYKKTGTTVEFSYSLIDKAGIASAAVTYTINAVASCVPYGKTIWLRSCTGKYVSSNDGCKPMYSDRCSVSCWEEFQVIDAGDCKVSLKCMGKYVSCENGTQPITCNRSVAQSWEEFDWIQNSNGTICLRGSNDKYVSCEDGTCAMTCNRDVASSWEEFNWQTCNPNGCGCSNSGSQATEISNRPVETTTDNDLSSSVAPLTFTVYPNPGRDIVTIALSEVSTDASQIFLINQLGVVVKSETLDANVQSTQLNVSTLPGGVYLVKVQVNGQILTSELLVK